MIDDEGLPRNVCPVAAHPRGYGFEEALVEAVRSWRYEPATLEGRPVAMALSVIETFDVGTLGVPLPHLYDQIFFKR